MCLFEDESVFWWRHLQPSIFSMVLLLFRRNILSSRFCQRHCVYFKTPIAAIHYIKQAGFTSTTTAQKRKFSIKYFYSKCDQICRKLQIWPYLLKKPLMENFIFVQWTFEGYCVYLRKAIVAPTFLRYLFFFRRTSGSKIYLKSTVLCSHSFIMNVLIWPE